MCPRTSFLKFLVIIVGLSCSCRAEISVAEEGQQKCIPLHLDTGSDTKSVRDDCWATYGTSSINEITSASPATLTKDEPHAGLIMSRWPMDLDWPFKADKQWSLKLTLSITENIGRPLIGKDGFLVMLAHKRWFNTVPSCSDFKLQTGPGTTSDFAGLRLVAQIDENDNWSVQLILGKYSTSFGENIDRLPHPSCDFENPLRDFGKRRYDVVIKIAKNRTDVTAEMALVGPKEREVVCQLIKKIPSNLTEMARDLQELHLGVPAFRHTYNLYEFTEISFENFTNTSCPVCLQRCPPFERPPGDTCWVSYGISAINTKPAYLLPSAQHSGLVLTKYPLSMDSPLLDKERWNVTVVIRINKTADVEMWKQDGVAVLFAAKKWFSTAPTCGLYGMTNFTGLGLFVQIAENERFIDKADWLASLAVGKNIPATMQNVFNKKECPFVSSLKLEIQTLTIVLSKASETIQVVLFLDSDNVCTLSLNMPNNVELNDAELQQPHLGVMAYKHRPVTYEILHVSVDRNVDSTVEPAYQRRFSTGAIVGFVIVVLCVILAIVVALVVIFRKRCIKSQKKSSGGIQLPPPNGAHFAPTGNSLMVGPCYVDPGDARVAPPNQTEAQQPLLGGDSYITAVSEIGNTDSTLFDADSVVLDRLPYDKARFELDTNRLHLLKEIGHGQYGQVYQAELLMPDSTTKELVAVKKVRNPQDQNQSRALLNEIKLMANIGKHPNIVSLIGAVTITDDYCAVLEYCKDGNLKRFLGERAPFYREIDDKVKTEPVNILTRRRLVSLAQQVASGMQYVHARHWVHRDLAARNILLCNDGELAKVTDFGLAKDIFENGIYQASTNKAIPWPWYAPEYLRKQLYYRSSDVWSFGVLLWEILSLGDCPIAINQICRDFMEDLESGWRWQQPKCSDDYLYTIMTRCWRLDPASRPDFEIINGQLNSWLQSKLSSN